MAVVTEIAPDLYRISTYIPEANLQFNQFLARDHDPLLFHTGLVGIYPMVLEAVSSLINPAQLRWIAFSHYEADECSTLNNWLQAAPDALPLCSMTAKIVSIDDVSIRPARAMEHNEVLTTGNLRFRFLRTPHLPHSWEAGLLFEETSSTLLCSDLLHQGGDVEPVTETSPVDRSRQVLQRYQHGPLANYFPYTPYSERLINELADLHPKTCATMHGSTYTGDGATALKDFGKLCKEIYGAQDVQPRAVV